jgi:hypothetical protein
MEKTATLKIIGREIQLGFNIQVKRGLTAGLIAQKLCVRDACLFRISGGRCAFLEPDVEIYKLINDGDEIVALVLDWEPHVAGGAELV